MEEMGQDREAAHPEVTSDVMGIDEMFREVWNGKRDKVQRRDLSQRPAL